MVNPMLEGQIMARMRVLNTVLEVVMVEMVEVVAFWLWVSPLPGKIITGASIRMLLMAEGKGFNHNVSCNSRGRRRCSGPAPRSPSSP